MIFPGFPQSRIGLNVAFAHKGGGEHERLDVVATSTFNCKQFPLINNKQKRRKLEC